MNVSQAIAEYIRSIGIKHVFGVVGGGAMYLNDAFHDLFIPCHHEQAAAFAADAYARLGGLGCCLVTTGPGGTNALTGLVASWIDSIPVIYLSGQVTADTMNGATGTRQLGVQGMDIVQLVRPITKDAIIATAETAMDDLRHLAAIARTPRSGPVWLDIPLDVQSAAN